MSHQDRTDIVVNHLTIKQVVDWLLAPALFVGFGVRSHAKWKPRMLAVAALLWGMGNDRTLGERFERSRKIVKKIFRWQLPPGTSYQGFMKMLRRWHVRLLLAIVPEVRVRMEETLPGQWEIAGFVVYAGDGSREELARTESLEEAFSPARKVKKRQQRQGRKGRRAKRQSAESMAKKAASPQLWLTLLWHVGTGLPWAWRTGPSDSSERGHLQEMLQELPENALITADAGFVGYEFWKAILDAQRHFLIRVGANVRLLRKLGYARQYDHSVYLWPDQVAKKRQPPLVLRLIEVHDGKQPMYLVTNADKSRLSDRQAARIYAARWGVELFFRTFKQTFGRRKLRSTSAENAPLELDWALLGLWCICLLAQRELLERGEDPARLSPVAAIKAFQTTLRDYRVRPETREESLWLQLGTALRDDYQRATSKTSRNYPRKKQRESIGAPQITLATAQQIHAANQLKQIELQERLAA
jgi:hypothetical protein